MQYIFLSVAEGDAFIVGLYLGLFAVVTVFGIRLARWVYSKVKGW